MRSIERAVGLVRNRRSRCSNKSPPVHYSRHSIRSFFAACCDNVTMILRFCPQDGEKRSAERGVSACSTYPHPVADLRDDFESRR